MDVLREQPASDVLIVGIGAMAGLALDVADILEGQQISVTVVDPRWVVPVASSIIDTARSSRIVITIEDGVRVGGIGTRVRQDLRAAGVDTPVDELGLPDSFLDHAEREEILQQVGLDAETVAAGIVAQLQGTRLPMARPAAEG